MNKIEELQLPNVVMICEKYVENPEDENNKKAYNELLDKIIVRNYIGLYQKNILLQKIMVDLLAEKVKLKDTGAIIELFTVMDGLLSYTNIKVDDYPEFKISDTVDILNYSGLIDVIESYCGKDYQTFIRMVQNTITLYNVDALMENVNYLDGEKIDNLAKSFDNFNSDSNIEMIKALGNLMGYNDNTTKNIKEFIENEAMDAANKIINTADQQKEDKKE